jgi:hypothetical protein
MRKSLVVVVAVVLVWLQPGAPLRISVAGMQSQSDLEAGEIDVSRLALSSGLPNGNNPLAEDSGGAIDLDQLCSASEQLAAAKGCCSHHGGVCGCKGGQDQCCDNSVSASCTCSTTSKTGCCSHHGGVCGCKGGKDVCCDKTMSPSCTC